MGRGDFAAIIVGHGSPRAEANAAFERFVERVASRLDGVPVAVAFFSLAEPTIMDQVAALVGRGASRIAVLPYFLHAGQHVSRDIPAQLDECRSRFPGLTIDLLGTLHNEPCIEDLLVERLMPFTSDAGSIASDAAGIAERSRAIIERRLRHLTLDPASRAIVRRAIHATADFSFAETIRIHPEAVGRGTAAIRAGAPVICDVQMLKAGLTHLENEGLCAISDADVKARAAAAHSTRAAAAMEKLSGRFEGAIIAIGNAPTALWKVLELVRAGAPRPALVVGLPVGFVGARESKQALLDSDLCYVTNVGPRGGSPVAAAVVNAIALLESKGEGGDA